MMSFNYEWKRFWCPRGKPINLSDGGFLYDPDSEYGRFLNPDLVSFEQLEDKPCLALLGEPGIGKSWALNNEKARADLSVRVPSGRSLWVDLRSFGSEERLWKTLFGNDEFAEWRKSDEILWLFLDSLDECLLRIDNVATLIADQLPREPVNRLRIRIACRTAPWPAILENALISAFGDNGFHAYELVPLRRRDVQHALQRRGITDHDSFFDRVEALDASSFAIKPVTLSFLINTYLRDGDLPENQIDLYERGCRILCEESNQSRVGSGKTGLLTLDERFAIASRIAAVTQFCSRFSVWTGGEASIPQEDVSISSIAGGEQASTADLRVSPHAILEVLDTGLFSSRGPNQIGWAHQTYAEFLAARYCVQHEMPTKQVHSLIFHPAGGGQRLVPQMYDIAAWLSVMNPQLFTDVAGGDPESLLGTAGASLSEPQRLLVVQSLLDQSDGGRLLSFRWNLFRLYPKLAHSGLADQLRPYVRDHARNLNTRELAMDVARACGLEQLGEDLVDVALDSSEPRVLRTHAEAAAAEVASPDAKARLRPFAFGQAGDDADDELKGIGLTATWPHSLNSTEMFSLLTPRKDEHLHGTYASFLYGLDKRLRAEDLPTALEWFSGQQQQRGIGPIDAVMDGVIRLAVKNLDFPGVLMGLTKAVLSRMRLHDRLISGNDEGDVIGQLSNDHAHRQMLLGELLPKVTDRELFWLHHAGVRLVPEVDLPWLIGRLEGRQDNSSSAVELNLIRRIIDTQRADQMDILWRACQTYPLLNAECQDLFAIPLESEAARMLREDIQRQQTPERKPLDPPPQLLIERDLTSIEQGNMMEWIRLARDLSLTPTSTDWEDIGNPDLTCLPGWISSTEAMRYRILSAALRYVNEGDPQNDQWFPSRNEPAIAASAPTAFRWS